MNKLFTIIACCCLWVAPLHADTIAVIGTGSVGGALGPEFAAQGHKVIYGSRNPNSEEVLNLVKRTGHGATAAKPADAAAKAAICGLQLPRHAPIRRAQVHPEC